jgi:hypothetical protein
MSYGKPFRLLIAKLKNNPLPIHPLGVELGIWQGEYQNMELPWLRWWDLQGNLLLTGEERADRLTAQLRSLGVEPEA